MGCSQDFKCECGIRLHVKLKVRVHFEWYSTARAKGLKSIKRTLFWIFLYKASLHQHSWEEWIYFLNELSQPPHRNRNRRVMMMLVFITCHLQKTPDSSSWLDGCEHGRIQKASLIFLLNNIFGEFGFDKLMRVRAWLSTCALSLIIPLL